MMDWKLLLLGTLIAGTLLVLILWRRKPSAPWMRHMSYLNAGKAHRAEWMAPSAVLEGIKGDYFAFYTYAAETLPKGWRAYLYNLEHYLSDDMLQSQRETVAQQLELGQGRYYGILRAVHRMEVRNFSPDGRSCLVIDYQTERRMATYDSRTGKRQHTQDLGDAALVYEMRYDRRRQRWKIARYIQTLPSGTRHFNSLNIHEPLQRRRSQ